MGIVRLGFLIVIYLVVANVARVHAQDWLYTVRDQDSLWKICQAHVAKPLCWIKLGQYNGLQNGNLIAPGLILKIPYAWLISPPLPAIVVESRGEVAYIPAVASAKVAWKGISGIKNASSMRAAGVSLQSIPTDGKIYMGDRLITGQGNASILFADGTQMLIRANTDITFDRISVKDGQGFVDTLLVLKKGATRYQVKGSGGVSRYKVRTPAGVAAVRGTEFRVNLDTEQLVIMRSEVLEGAVRVSDNQGKSAQQVPKGYGVRSEPNKPIPIPQQLLPRIEWQDDGQPTLSRPVQIQWQRLVGAQSYRIDLYDQKGLVESWRTEENYWQDQVLADGKYRLLVRAIDQLGLQGFDAEREFTVVTPLPVPQLTSAGIGQEDKGRVHIQWPRLASATGYRIEVALDPQFKKIVIAEESINPEYRFKQRTGVYTRVSALYSDRRESDFSEAIWVDPPPDNWKPWIGIATVVLAVILF